MQEFDGDSQVDFADPVVRPGRTSRAGGKRYIDTFYRHWVIALIPIIVLPLAAFAVARLSGKSTTATTSIWVNQDSVKQLSYADPLVTPAANTTAAVLQLLQTGAFDMLVARESPAYWSTMSGKPDPKTVVLSDLSKNVKVVANGPDLVTITYSSKSALTGTQLLQSIVKEIPRQIAQLNRQQAASSTSALVRQRADAQQRLTQATKQLGTYMKDHNISPAQMALQSLFDPKFAALYQAVQSDQVDIRTAEQQLSQLAPSGATGSIITVYDQPSAPPPSLSKKTLALDMGIGLLVGLLLSGTFVVLTTARDHSLRYPEEVTDLLGLQVLASVPYADNLATRGPEVHAASNGRKLRVGRKR